MGRRRRFTDQQEQEITRRYLAGEDTSGLGKAYGCSPTTIAKVLERNGAKRRTRAEAKKLERLLSPEKEAQICRRYTEGESSRQLADAFDTSNSNVLKILKRNGVKTRSISEAKMLFDDATEAEISRRYLLGENSYELAKAFKVDPSTIRDVLERNSVDRRSNTESQGGLNPEQEQEVCNRYEKGETTVELGVAFDVSTNCINRILQRNSIERRNSSEAQGGLSADLRPEICRRYEAGENTYELGEAFGVSASHIGTILKLSEVEMRAAGYFYDNLPDALSASGAFAQKRDCAFYIYEVARFPLTHCKPGISFDIDNRADDEYGDEYLRIDFDSRIEAFFLEQAVLEATKELAVCPPELLNWKGSKEIRAMPASELEPLVLQLANELENLGVWDFACRYVAMTAKQRAVCQEKASA